MLVQHPGEVVTRDEIRKSLWPSDTIVEFEHSISSAMNRLRQALADSAEAPRYIETLPKRGYRFIASVEDREGIPPSQTLSRRRLWFRTRMVMMLMAVVASVGWLIRQESAPQRVMKQRQLTANTSEIAVRNGAISPDGKYLAFSDSKVIYLKLIATGDTRAIRPPDSPKDSTPVAWFIGPWFPDGTRFLANMQKDRDCSIWVIPILGGTSHKIRDDAWAWAVSPDGLRIAFTRNHPASVASGETSLPSQEIWLMSSNGEHPEQFLSASDRRDGFRNVQWSPNGKRLAYDVARQNDEQNRLEQIIQTRDLNSRSLTTVLSNPQLQDFRWLREGRIFYSLAEDRTSDNLWEIRVDTSTGVTRGQPHQLTNWAGFHIGSLSATADSKRVAFLKSSLFSSVYVGEFDKRRATMKPPRRLTFTEAIDLPLDWTPDGKFVIFTSNRTGHWSIFKQALDQDFAEIIFPGKEGAQDQGAHLSPDGKWIVYSEYRDIPQPQNVSQLALERIMRVPLAGGPPEFIFSARVYGGIRCSRAPADLCIFSEEAPDEHQLIFSAFDPIKGRGRELARLPKDPKIDLPWNFSPDGKRIAALVPGAASVHMVPLDGDQPRDITVKGWPPFNCLDFSADSMGFFVNSMTNGGGTLLYVDLNGKAHPLWQSAFFIWGIPSWDGRRLAILGLAMNGNLWMLENF
jgi:Tol biopolymer transport system component